MSSNFSDIVRKTQSKHHKIFRYSPLFSGQIRILKLFPGQLESPLEISLKEYSLGAVGCDFEALSYVWGNPTRQVSIKCNGAELKITTSVQRALCRLRYHDKCRMLWVDAICINQEDFDERAQQVLLMNQIYPAAYKVLVWLGEEKENDIIAISAINEWAIFNRQYQRDSDAIRFSKFEEHFALKPGYRETLDAVSRLTYRPWFNRCWTFHEILLSTNAELLIGEFQIEWESFYHALLAFPLHLLAENVVNFNALLMCHGRAKVKNIAFVKSDSFLVSQNLSRMLQITRNFVATDPRDKIFCTLSLSVTRNPCMFRPDYKISTRQTFISFTFAMILHENSLDIIRNCGERERNKTLPSWCPDWGCEPGVTVTTYYDYISYNVNAGLMPHLESLEIKKNSELELEGALIDVVEKIFDLEALADELKASAGGGSIIEVLSEFVRETDLQECLLHDQLSPEAVLLRTLSADHWFFGAHPQGSQKEYWFPTHFRLQDSKQKKNNSPTLDIDKSHSTIKSQSGLEVSSMNPLSIQQDRGSDVSFDTGPEPEHLDYEVESPFTYAVIEKVYRQASPFYEEGQDFDEAKNIDSLTLSAIANEAISQALFFIKGKKLLISKRGFVAIGPENTKVGDSFCSFWGADVPFIIRKKEKHVFEKIVNKFSKKEFDTGADMYEIIGECYIDGIMYGELFQDVNGTGKNVYQKSREKKVIRAHQKLKPLADWVKIMKFRIT